MKQSSSQLIYPSALPASKEINLLCGPLPLTLPFWISLMFIPVLQFLCLSSTADLPSVYVIGQLFSMSLLLTTWAKMALPNLHSLVTDFLFLFCIKLSIYIMLLSTLACKLLWVWTLFWREFFVQFFSYFSNSNTSNKVYNTLSVQHILVK